MKETNETTAEESNEELSNLKGALQQALDEGDMQRAGSLKEKMLPHLETLKGFKTNADIFKEAEEIMGKDFLGPQAIENTFGIHLESKDVPKIPFSKEELENAKILAQFLVLRTDKAPDGKDLTIMKMEKIAKDVSKPIMVGRQCKRALKKEGLINELPRKGWALVTKHPLDYNVDVMSHNATVIGYLKRNIFDGQEIPIEYERAFEEFAAALDFVKDLRIRGGKKSENNDIIKNLKITELTKPSVSEVIYDSLVYQKNNGIILQKDLAILTKSCPLSKGFVFVGSGENNFYLDFFSSIKHSGKPGATLSRRS
ncbi:MAG: hypothetical protein Q7S53_05230 [bacterium]|nr:hypothetical protein [bacterium]